MGRYAFVAKTRAGRTEKGVLEAPNPDEAISILQSRELVVLSVSEAQEGPVTIGPKGGVVKRSHRKATAQDLATFARSLAAMSEAGLPLLRALEVVRDQCNSRVLTTAIDDVARDVRGGSTFRDAIAKHDKIFSPFWISLVETGEASGQLTRAMEQIAIHLEKAGAIQRKVVSALIYPAVLMGVSVIAILVFTLKIIPTFASLFTSFGAKLPFITQLVIDFSAFLRKFFLLIVLGVVGIYFFISNYIKGPGRWQFDMLKLRAPIFGPLFQCIAAERFSSNLGTLLKAGVPILHALEIVIDTCGNLVVGSLIEHMRKGVREGRPLAEPLSRSDIFPPMIAQMIAVGEQTGKLSTMLEEVAKYYEEQASTMVERMTTLLEPLMLIGMGLVIGVLVVSMYLPIFQISQSLKG